MDTIVVLDFGSQYNQLIVRRIREAGVYAIMLPFDTSYETLVAMPEVKGIVLSGGPKSVYEADAFTLDAKILEGPWPILGICYGMQLLVQMLGGKVERASQQEYGLATIEVQADPLFQNTPSTQRVWMSHGDACVDVPSVFRILSEHPTMYALAIRHLKLPIYGVQFHPEVHHSDFGAQILSNFATLICQAKSDWNMTTAMTQAIVEIRHTVQDKRVILGLSGGVDSSVAAMLLHQAIGSQLTCLFVDHGLLRIGEAEQVMETFSHTYGLDVRLLDVKNRFLDELSGVTDPEQKRKIIGKVFVDVFQEAALELGEVSFLAQGTLYTDIIESGTKTAHTIKSHHNVGGLPETLSLKLIEPLKTLFKDEVRLLGETLGLPSSMVNRQPFPGPGLAIRLIGEVNAKRLAILRQTDRILHEEVKLAGLHSEIWQYFTVLLDTKSVGVQGDQRVYEDVVAIRAVTSTDGMTADFARIDYAVLAKISNRMTNEVRGVSRVVYDITSKPPGTIEWE
jgi:GMP synthase (glutamine-hydrolysing)